MISNSTLPHSYSRDLARPRYLDLLRRYRDTESVKVLSGVRRCGKSTLLRLWKQELLDSGVPENHIYLRRFDDFSLPLDLNAQWLQADLQQAFDAADPNKPFYVLLDEVQDVTGWEKIVRGLHTSPGVDVYLTGSNAYVLSGDLATRLSGRYVILEIYPLSFQEYLDFVTTSQETARSEEALFADYLRFGGMPGLFQLPGLDTETVTRELTTIFDSVILRDVAARLQVRELNVLEKLVRYVFSTSGSLFSTRSIVNTLKSSGYRVSGVTLDSYLDALSRALLIYPVEQMGLRGKEILRPLRKFYPVDTGLRNLTTGFAPTDVGYQLENLVYLELRRRGFTVSVGALPKGEVDFVAEKNGERVYFQVADDASNEKVMTRELTPLQAIEDAFPKLLLTTDYLHTGIRPDGIRVLHVIDWLTGRGETASL